jgi:hypothetical protein
MLEAYLQCVILPPSYTADTATTPLYLDTFLFSLSPGPGLETGPIF